jgi:hypothetical protein
MGSAGDGFRVRWNDFGNNFIGSIRQLRDESDFLDVTLVTSDSGPRFEGNALVYK